MAEFNKAFEKSLEKADTSDAVRRVDGAADPNTVQLDTET